VPALAGEAARRARLRAQALERNVGTAIHAQAIGAVGDAPARGLKLAQLADVAGDFGLVEVRDQVGERLLAAVVRRAGQLRVLLVARARRP
jgi:hypothetical protein